MRDEVKSYKVRNRAIGYWLLAGVQEHNPSNL